MNPKQGRLGVKMAILRYLFGGIFPIFSRFTWRGGNGFQNRAGNNHTVLIANFE
jgi:hypothetical protein